MGCDLRKYSPRTFCICTLRCEYIHNGGIDGRKAAPTAPHLLTSTVPHLVTSMPSHVLTSTPPYFSNLLVISLPRLLVAQTSAASSLAIDSVLPKPNTSLSMVVPSSTITAANEAKKAIDNNTRRGKEDTTCTSCCEACEHFTP